MKVNKAIIKMESACQPVLSESLVEGRLSLPADRADIERVLFVQGRIYVNAEPADGKVFMDGNVEFTVVYIGIDGGIDSFEAVSPFRHTEDMAGACAGMNILARGSVREVSSCVEEGRTVSVKGVVSVQLNGSVTKSREAVTGAEQPNLQTKTTNKRLKITRDQRRETAYIREDVRVPQTMPVAEKVLFADAYAIVRGVRTEDLKVIVEGDIKLTVLYLSADKGAPLQQMIETMPFGQIIASEGIAASDTIYADAALTDVQVNVADEASDVLRLSARMIISCVAKGESETQYMEDAYSLDNRLDIQYDNQICKEMVLTGNARAIARSAIAIPASQPAVSRIICLRAMPNIAAVRPGVDRVYIEGLMMYTMCYYSSEGMWSYSGETPFEAEVSIDGVKPEHDVEICADVESCTFDGTGRDISVKFMMDVEIRAFAQTNLRLVSSLSKTDERVLTRQGITIYFADGGESTWDIAKRFAATLETVKKFNPEIGDKAEIGQKILIMS
ncbi:MAG: DUF3794 domain-containing protein [Christensenellales bacterium]